MTSNLHCQIGSIFITQKETHYNLKNYIKYKTRNDYRNIFKYPRNEIILNSHLTNIFFFMVIFVFNLSVSCQPKFFFLLATNGRRQPKSWVCGATSYRPMTNLPACENLAKSRSPSFLAYRLLWAGFIYFYNIQNQNSVFYQVPKFVQLVLFRTYQLEWLCFH